MVNFRNKEDFLILWNQDLIAYQDLINGNNNYKYQKLELEELIKKAKKQEIEFEHKINQYLTQTNFNSILNKLNNLESLKSHIEQEISHYFLFF